MPTGLELLGRAGAYAPLFLFPNPPLSFVFFDLYLYSEGTQASTLWRVSSWSPSRSCSFRCVSPSPTTLTPTASLESTFDRLPGGGSSPAPSLCCSTGLLACVLIISTSVTRCRPASSSLVEQAPMLPSFSSPIPLSLSFSSISICTLRARRLAPCGVSPPGLLPVRAPSVVSHHLRRLSPPLLA